MATDVDNYFNNVLAITEGELNQLLDSSVEQTRRFAGMGSYFSTHAAVLSRIDRFGINPLPPNNELHGLTFFTRPKLNLSTASIRGDNILSMLDTTDPGTVNFAIRCYLDRRWAASPKIRDLAAKCPFFNDTLPFIVPLTNCLTSITGFPEYVLDTATSESGFFGEAQVTAAGSDDTTRPFEITANFRDVQGGFLWTLFLVWIRWIALAKKGLVNAYVEDIAANRLCYTSACYRLQMDPSRRGITKWYRAQGCFPKVHPFGASANINERESYVTSNGEFAMTFAASIFRGPDPRVLQAFNTIVGYTAGDIISQRNNQRLVVAPVTAEANFAGIPYIDVYKQYSQNELVWLCRPEELQRPTEQVIAQITRRLAGVASQFQ